MNTNHTDKHIVSKLSRRDAIKLIGISPVAAGVLVSTKSTTDVAASEDVSGKIVIVGGGAGAIMALSRLYRAISDPDITIIAPNEIHLYQPGQVFVGAGIMKYEDLLIDNNDYIDTQKVRWIKDEVKTFDAKNNQVVTNGGESVAYDTLLIATGVEYLYEKINGLTKEDIGRNGITSVYLSDLAKGSAKGATATWQWYQDVKAFAKKKKPTVLFTHPNTPIKCGGAPQKMLYLCADYLKEDNLEADYIFATSNKSLFHLREIDQALHTVQQRYHTITNKFEYNLQTVDVKNKVATFIHAYEKKVYDPDFEVYETQTINEKIEIPYDFLHVVPPMSPVGALRESDLLDMKGWLDVDKYTLQHKKYKNIFGIGDVCGIPMGKTGGSARHHGPVVTANMITFLQGKELKEKFDGYTVCPLKTQYGKIIMAEFNYEGPAPTLPIAYDKPRWMWWAFDLYMLEPMYKYLMLTGRF